LGAAAVPIVLAFLLVFFAWRMVFSFNRDLIRARAWGELVRRTLPFAALTLMAFSLYPVQAYGVGWALTVWGVASAVLIVVSNLFSMPTLERRANKAFRRGDYGEAATLYRELVEESPLARHYAFLGAALGAGEHYEESLDASTQAIKKDPRYGLAYYNRALVLRRMNRKSRAVKDLDRALESDLPRRFKVSARKLREELS
jgi:tetratricopeptide (TPR) repeat protein